MLGMVLAIIGGIVLGLGGLTALLILWGGAELRRSEAEDSKVTR